MTIFKILGLISVLLACTFLGASKANNLSLRSKKLASICISLEKLAELVNCGTGELNKLLQLSFEKEVLVIENNEPILKKEGLLRDDIEFLNKLLAQMGIYDREKEYKQIMLYKAMLEGQRKNAEEQAGRLCKLYNSLGFLIGLSICIFLI